MNDPKAKKVLKHFEVVVSVKQRMALSQTESSNDAVDRSPNRMAAFAECAIVPRGRDGQRLTSTFEHLEVA